MVVCALSCGVVICCMPCVWLLFNVVVRSVWGFACVAVWRVFVMLWLLWFDTVVCFVCDLLCGVVWRPFLCVCV